MLPLMWRVHYNIEKDYDMEIQIWCNKIDDKHECKLGNLILLHEGFYDIVTKLSSSMCLLCF